MIEDSKIVFLDGFCEALRLLPKQNLDTHVLDPVIDYYHSLPEEITKSDIYKMADSIDAMTQYEDIQWITSYDITYVDTKSPGKYIQNQFDASTELNKYIRKVVANEAIGKREKVVVLLSLFESYLYSKVECNQGKGIKEKFKNAVLKDDKYSSETIALAVTYAIVRIVFANTDKQQFDRHLPHRNDILHNGTLAYKNDEIESAYELLITFICIIDELF